MKTELLQNIAKTLKIELSALQALLKVESRICGINDGQPVILFERHIFYRQLKKQGFDVEQLSKTYPSLVNASSGGYIGGLRENYRLKLAKQIDEQSAIESASWGLFQIMGFHWQLLGYKSAQEFEQLMSQSEDNQLDAFCRFISHKSNKKMLQALQALDFATFAKLYNGPSYKKNRYDEKLGAEYEYFSNLNQK